MRSMCDELRLKVGLMISRAERGYDATSVNVAGFKYRRIPVGGSCLVEAATSDADERPFV
jgi:hypothetical protein